MTQLSTLPIIVALPVCFVGGLVLGYVYFRSLRKTADLIVVRGSVLPSLALTVGRLVLLCAGFFLAVQVSGFALLAALAGVLVARALMLRRTQETCL